MNEHWTKEEVILIVTDYFDMFGMELSSTPYNKAEHRRKLATLLKNRDKAIEFKHRNISGVLAKMGVPYIKGYKPLFRFQQLLEDEVNLYLNKNWAFFEKRFKIFVDEKVDLKIKKRDYNNIIEKAGPSRTKIIEKTPLFIPNRPNYLAKEQNNRILGEEGELLVFEYEKWRLTTAGKISLAEKVEWVSKEKGDGLGFDILSKSISGKDMYIEVKTTKLTKETPVYFSRNELIFSKIKERDFFLYRVFDFKEKPKIFIKRGSYESFCSMQPQSFEGYF
ncbi:MAG TPA: DUF3883 domain-containing protein [Chitinophagaceae bacterium]|jgi:hypothetical protein|nr:DUF3883 domain-containing protein [Chitinophagaceae bacterium]HMU59839.1 DUF3883 domain-containing protein [Chitinophagaceae bacterium]